MQGITKNILPALTKEDFRAPNWYQILPLSTPQSQTAAKMLHFLQMKCFPATVSKAMVPPLGFFSPSLFPKERKGCDHTIFSLTLTCNNSGT